MCSLEEGRVCLCPRKKSKALRQVARETIFSIDFVIMKPGHQNPENQHICVIEPYPTFFNGRKIGWSPFGEMIRKSDLEKAREAMMKEYAMKAKTTMFLMWMRVGMSWRVKALGGDPNGGNRADENLLFFSL